MRLLAAVPTLLACLLLPSAASAQASLAGEIFRSVHPAATITGGHCDPSGISTIEYEISGIAVGPYPGTFTETGRAKLGPIVDGSAPVLAFEADFTAESPNGTIEGSRWLTPPPTPLYNQHVGWCANTGGGQWLATLHSFYSGYAATITTGDSTSTDRGQAGVTLNAYTPAIMSSPPDDPANSGFNFQEHFNLGTPPDPQCSNGIDDDGDGSVDLAADADCRHAHDDSEAPWPATPPPPPPPAADRLEVLSGGTQREPGETHYLTAQATEDGERVAGITVRFTVDGASGHHELSCVTVGDGRCVVEYVGTQRGHDTITAYADNDGDGIRDEGEPEGTATADWGTEDPPPPPPAEPEADALALTPAEARSRVGSEHTLTASATEDGAAAEGVTVRFTVGGASGTHELSCVTGGDGRCSVSYAGTRSGHDAISAYADNDDDQVRGALEPVASATTHWDRGLHRGQR